MFSDLLLVALLIAVTYMLLEQKKIKSSVVEIKKDSIKENEPSKPVYLKEYDSIEWWEKNVPDITFSTKILKNNSVKPETDNIENNKAIIKESLDGFGIKYEDVKSPIVGPAATLYPFRPKPGVRIQDVVDFKKDFALALSMDNIKIVAPIPGTNLIGFEIPNKQEAVVGLKEELESGEYQKAEGDLIISLGKDPEYKSWNRSLVDMPHLLVAGATNSGKSVFLHSVVTSFMHQHTPEELRFILVDPKQVEFDYYTNSPHLLSHVITTPKKALKAFKWCLEEMDRRYDTLANNECRNIKDYNKKAKVKMPYIVYVIDELADLMVVSPKYFEGAIIRLAMMARAIGIHLIIATQRPSEDVITGMIKANMPARLAFSVASKDDSRIILDTGGAEKLLGQGDSLYSDAEMPKPIRLKIPYISEEEVVSMGEYIRKKTKDFEIEDAIDASMPDYEDDILLEEAKDIVVQYQKASASFLQRKLRIGYARAASILDQLEELGIIGPNNGSTPREVLLNKSE